MKLQRYPGNPILKPHLDHPWEDLAVFNPAAIYDEQRQEVLMLYQSEFAKYNSTEYRFYANVTNLSQGTYSYYGWANDSAGNSGHE